MKTINGMAKAMKLLMLLLASGLMSAHAQSRCYTAVGFPGYIFSKFNYPQTLSCQPREIFPLNVGSLGEITNEDKLWEEYEARWEACKIDDFYWNCPVRHQWKDVNRVHSTWNRESAACRQHMTNYYNKYKGRMCD